MSKDLLSSLKQSENIQDSNEWDATYRDLPVVIAENVDELPNALSRLDVVGGYGYIATWEKNLFSFPIFVGPFITTCEFSSHLSPILTSAPITQ